MKRLLFVLLTGLLTISLVGCSSKAGPTQDNAADQTTSSIAQDNTTALAAGSPNSAAATRSISMNAETNAASYNDGTYEGKSSITSENYYGKTKITINNGLISDIDFTIYDAGQFKNVLPEDKAKDIKEMALDEQYGKLVFADSELYQQQCINELAGIKKYNSEMVEKQDIKEVDAVSGATWSFGLYAQAVKDALGKASKKKASGKGNMKSWVQQAEDKGQRTIFESI
jgi:major membrane immunogen (membrane-anchored lipoprotein)